MREKLLFTPGPLNTSDSVKNASVRDLGSRDDEFISTVREIREELLTLAHAEKNEYQSVIMQGSGTFGVESVISSSIPPDGMLLNIVNGAYGKRISDMAQVHRIPVHNLTYPEHTIPTCEDVENSLRKMPQITHVSLVHGETTTGLLNPLNEIAEVVKKYNKVFIVDAMSTFGAYDINIKKLGIHFLIASSNKCIEGIPGFSFAIAEKQQLIACKSIARTLSLDLYQQWMGLENNGQFRFTPPVQSIIAFKQAIRELKEEGGIEARGKRYQENNRILVDMMRAEGFETYVPDEYRSFIITAFLYPEIPTFDFRKFYTKLSEQGLVIYPGKLSNINCFRIGNIGKIFPDDIKRLVEKIKLTISEL